MVENFSAGTADRMGIGYERARRLNPRIVYLSISGFGAGEPGKGMDSIFQALSGLMTHARAATATRRSGTPCPFGDLIGPLFARDRHARGAAACASGPAAASTSTSALLGALTSLLATEPWDTMERAGIETRTGNVVPRLAPFGIFATTDGFVAVCAPRPSAFARGVFEAIGRPELVRGRAVREPRPPGRQRGGAARR